MPLSNNSDAVARFWRKYLNFLGESGVKEAARKWYLRHAESYLKASGGRRLATHTAAEVERWLAELGRIGRMPAWQYAQAVDAVRYLLVLARAPAAKEIDWSFWRASRVFPADHPTVSRSAIPAPSAPEGRNQGSGAAAAVASLVAVIRQRNYSIRTEEAYRGWAERFIAFIGGGDLSEAGAREVKAFLQALAVQGRVAASTQNQALNALVFLYDKVLERPLGDLGSFARAKRPQRLPVVLAPAEVARLLARLEGMHATMAALLDGTGMRLMECLRLRVKDIDFLTVVTGNVDEFSRVECLRVENWLRQSPQ
jgi:hypothetical protein